MLIEYLKHSDAGKRTGPPMEISLFSSFRRLKMISYFSKSTNYYLLLQKGESSKA